MIPKPNPDMNEPFTIFFPPRLYIPDFTKGDHNAVLDDAVDKYMEESIALLDEDSTKDAQKIIEFAKAFPQLHPNYVPPPEKA